MRLKPARLIGLAVIGAAVIFSVQGGEYGTSDLLRQRSKKRRLEMTVDSLRAVVDSLARYKQALLTDAELQERIAREEFGMVRGDKELLYRLVPAPGGGGSGR